MSQKLISIVTPMVGVVMLLAGADVAKSANENLPNGKPFQVVQGQIEDLESAMQQEIADLQAELATLENRVDQQAESEAKRDELLAALRFAVTALEQRLSSAEASIEELQAYNILQDQELDLLQQRVDTLTLEIVETHGHIDSLFQTDANHEAALQQLQALFGVQRDALAALQQRIEFLEGQVNADVMDLAVLRQEFDVLQQSYDATLHALELGCRATGYYLKALDPYSVVCGQDTGVQPTFVTVGASVPVPPRSHGHVRAYCPIGYEVSGGGHGDAYGVHQIRYSQPGHYGGQHWYIGVYNPTDSQYSAAAIARCMRVAE